MGVNKVILVGNVGGDPEIKSFDGGYKNATFSLATSKKFKNKSGEKIEKTEWHRLVAWDPLSGIVEQYVTKGSQLYIEGELQTRQWEKDNVKHYTTEIIVRNMQMLGKSGSGGNNSSAQVPDEVKAKVTPGDDMPMDDLPF